MALVTKTRTNINLHQNKINYDVSVLTSKFATALSSKYKYKKLK